MLIDMAVYHHAAVRAAPGAVALFLLARGAPPFFFLAQLRDGLERHVRDALFGFRARGLVQQRAEIDGLAEHDEDIFAAAVEFGSRGARARVGIRALGVRFRIGISLRGHLRVGPAPRDTAHALEALRRATGDRDAA